MYGFQPLDTQVVSSQHMEKLIWKGASTYVIQCHQIESQDSEQEDPEMKKSKT